MTEIRPPDVGDVAPDFTLPDATTTPCHLADLCAERPQSRDRVLRFRSLDRTVMRVDLDGLFAFIQGGLEQAPPNTPARSRIIPAARDWLRFTRNALRYGIRTPKS